MKIRLSSFVPESIVDGEGIRSVVFTQGCPHNCPGCHNQKTIPFEGGKLVDVDDVVKAMLLLMESEIKNERFIVISENLSFKEFLQQTALALNVKPPSKKASNTMLALGWRLDWLHRLFTGRRRRLSKQMTKSARSITAYDASKLKNALNFEFKPMQKSIKETAKRYLEDLNKSTP